MKKENYKKTINCFIIDDEIDARERLKSLLGKVATTEVIGSETASERTVKMVTELRPDIVFMDVEMPRINGFEAVNMIREQNFSPTFIFVTAYNQYAIKAIKKAAFDFLLKPICIDELNQTIERYTESNSVSPNKLKKIPSYNSLSEREIEVLELMLNGHTSKEIAKKLFITKNTVDTHRRNIHSKTNTSSTIELLNLL